MNIEDQTLCLSQLAMARIAAGTGASHCREAIARGSIIGLTELPKMRLAQIHFEQAEQFLTAALQKLGPVTLDLPPVAEEKSVIQNSDDTAGGVSLNLQPSPEVSAS